MKLASSRDIPKIQAVFDQATRFANEVSFTDWPLPFPEEWLEDYVSHNSLYYFGNLNSGYLAALKLTTEHDDRIWFEENGNLDRYLYLGKYATADAVRGQHFTERVTLPALMRQARSLGKQGVRLDCLADTSALGEFYEGVGFTNMGDVTLASDTDGEMIRLDRMQLDI